MAGYIVLFLIQLLAALHNNDIWFIRCISISQINEQSGWTEEGVERTLRWSCVGNTLGR